MSEALRAVLARLPPLAGRSLAGFVCEPLPGLTNRSYKITLADACDESYVVRLPGVGSERYIDRAVEAHNAELAAELGLCPPILYHDVITGVQLRRYINGGVALDRAALRALAMLARVAGLLHRLHTSGAPFRGQREVLAQLDHYLALAARRGAPEHAELRRLRAALERLRPWLDTNLAPCHIDPTPSNFLWQAECERLYLLDWEYSALASPLWDLAGLTCEADFTSQQNALLLESYYGAWGPDLQRRLTLYQAALDAVAATWAAAQPAASMGVWDDYIRARVRRAQIRLEG